MIAAFILILKIAILSAYSLIILAVSVYVSKQDHVEVQRPLCILGCVNRGLRLAS